MCYPYATQEGSPDAKSETHTGRGREAETAAERAHRGLGFAAPGFGLRIAASGLKTWQAFYRVNGKTVREKLGTLAQIPNVADARELARQSMAKAQAGAHPVEDRRRREQQERKLAQAEEARKKNTLGAVIDRYLAERPSDKSRRPMRAEYLAETARTLKRDVKQSPLGRRPLDEITADDIKQLVRGIAKDAPSQANHTLAYLKAMLS